MAEMGTLPIDHTICLFSAVLNNLENGITQKALAQMADEFDVENAEAWTSLQCSMGDRIQRDRDAGYIDDEQLDFALTWLSTLDQTPFEEAVEQFFAWVEWVRNGK